MSYKLVHTRDCECETCITARQEAIMMLEELKASYDSLEPESQMAVQDALAEAANTLEHSD